MSLLQLNKVDICTASGRMLFRQLQLSMGKEQVAIIGRNGVGKSHLMRVLAQLDEPQAGSLVCRGSSQFVGQLLPPQPNLSPGQTRLVALQKAFGQRPSLLLLDEPGQDLDAQHFAWLQQQLSHWRNGLLMVSHDRRLLSLFRQFLLISETGCRYFAGEFTQLLQQLRDEEAEQQQRYFSQSLQLLQQEWRNQTILQRRQQKQRQGRWREAGRMTSRMRLNSKRSYAQVSQGKVALIRQQRIQQTRASLHELRQTLQVDLPLKLHRPVLSTQAEMPVIQLENVAVAGLFGPISLSIHQQKLAIVGANGTGKTTLLNIMLQQSQHYTGHSRCQRHVIGYIAQNASNWMEDESLLQLLYQRSQLADINAAIKQLQQHHFPLALAQRPLHSLSPGERLRAALICLFNQPNIQCLVLDEPSESLDLLGYEALVEVLQAWAGALVLVSHDAALLERVGVALKFEL